MENLGILEHLGNKDGKNFKIIGIDNGDTNGGMKIYLKCKLCGEELCKTLKYKEGKRVSEYKHYCYKMVMCKNCKVVEYLVNSGKDRKVKSFDIMTRARFRVWKDAQEDIEKGLK